MKTTITPGMKLTMNADGLIGEMVVTAIEPCNPDMPFYEGDIVRVRETVRDGDATHEYDTFFMSNKLVDDVLVYNGWTWTVENYQRFTGCGVTVELYRQGDTISYILTGAGITEQVGTSRMSEAEILDILLAPMGIKADGANLVQASL